MATCGVRLARNRTVLFVSAPALWPHWPFLPLVRRTSGREELGVVFDARALQMTGYSATVFFSRSHPDFVQIRIRNRVVNRTSHRPPNSRASRRELRTSAPVSPP